MLLQVVCGVAVVCSSSELSASSGEPCSDLFFFFFFFTVISILVLRALSLCRGFGADVALKSLGVLNCHSSWWWGRKAFN